MVFKENVDVSIVGDWLNQLDMWLSHWVEIRCTPLTGEQIDAFSSPVQGINHVVPESYGSVSGLTQENMVRHNKSPDRNPTDMDKILSDLHLVPHKDWLQSRNFQKGKYYRKGGSFFWALGIWNEEC